MKSAYVLIAVGALMGCESSKPVCMFSPEVQQISVLSTGSHASATTELTLDVASRRFHGTTFNFEDETFTTVKVDRTLTDDEFANVKDAFSKTCGSPTSVETPAAIGGGSTSWTVTTADGSTLFATHPLTVTERWVRLERPVYMALWEAWPKE